MNISNEVFLKEARLEMFKQGKSVKQLAIDMCMSYTYVVQIFNGFSAMPQGFERKVRSALNMQILAPSSGIDIKAIADKLRIHTSGVDQFEIENKVISTLIPEYPKMHIIMANGEVRKALITAAIEIFNKKEKCSNE